jgi:gamma-glutamylcyclotransferase (GGCT)/AIG2-like uncharacterized protein YtfP
MPIRVFVYGSLKNGQGNHRLLAKAKFLGRSYIEGNYRMVSLGGFPGVIRHESIPMNRIVGEVYQVDEDTLQSLDVLEGHPRFYKRDKVPTSHKNAWCYFLPHEYGDKYPQIAHVWRPSNEEREWMAGAFKLEEPCASSPM